jgi:hypothetical protein
MVLLKAVLVKLLRVDLKSQADARHQPLRPFRARIESNNDVNAMLQSSPLEYRQLTPTHVSPFSKQSQELHLGERLSRRLIASDVEDHTKQLITTGSPVVHHPAQLDQVNKTVSQEMFECELNSGQSGKAIAGFAEFAFVFAQVTKNEERVGDRDIADNYWFAPTADPNMVRTAPAIGAPQRWPREISKTVEGKVGCSGWPGENQV